MIIYFTPVIVFALQLFLEFIYDVLGSHLMYDGMKKTVITSLLVSGLIISVILLFEYIIADYEHYRWQVLIMPYLAVCLPSILIYKSAYMEYLKHHVDYEAVSVIPFISFTIVFMLR